jgi:hypothetical protein
VRVEFYKWKFISYQHVGELVDIETIEELDEAMLSNRIIRFYDRDKGIVGIRTNEIEYYRVVPDQTTREVPLRPHPYEQIFQDHDR